MISISRRMLTMSCSSLIFSFRIDLIATWKEQKDKNIFKIQVTLSVLNINITKPLNCVFYSLHTVSIRSAEQLSLGFADMTMKSVKY